jgi:hypothetical protein
MTAPVRQLGYDRRKVGKVSKYCGERPQVLRRHTTHEGSAPTGLTLAFAFRSRPASPALRNMLPGNTLN